MDNEKIIEHIAEIEREIAVLPAGGVSKKTVHGNIYYYHRITQNAVSYTHLTLPTTPYV